MSFFVGNDHPQRPFLVGQRTAVLPVAKQQYTRQEHRIGLSQRKQRPATVRAADHHELRKAFAADGFSARDTDRFIARFSFSNQKTASEAVASVISSAR
jgi:hypothetical protein